MLWITPRCWGSPGRSAHPGGLGRRVSPPCVSKHEHVERLTKDRVAERFLRSRGWDDTWDEDAVLEDIRRLCTLTRATGGLNVERTLTFWRRLRERRYPATLIHSSVQTSDPEDFVPEP